MSQLTREVLLDYLHDALPDAEAAAVEKAVRESPAVAKQLEQVRQSADRGEHTVGAVWRREHLSCPSRDQLGAYLLHALDPDLLDYITFHLGTVGCPYCQANLDDLRKLQAEVPGLRTARRRKILDSSHGVLRDVTKK